MTACTLRYWAAAKAAAGTHEEPYDAATLADLLASARNRHGRNLAIVLDRSTFLIDGVAVGSKPHDDVVLADGTVVEVLPPFAGG